MSKPVFILSPGAWHTSEVYNKLVPHLEAKGHRTVLHDWPSITQAPLTSFDEDIQAIRTTVLREADAGNDVVIVAHSWSGSPVNSSVADLSKAERAKQGKPGGIVKLVFLCAFVVSEGVSLLGAMGGDDSKIPLWNVQVRLPLPLQLCYTNCYFRRAMSCTPTILRTSSSRDCRQKNNGSWHQTSSPTLGRHSALLLEVRLT